MSFLNGTHTGSVVINEKSINHKKSPEPTDAENIPYHARKNAKPFTYGHIPAGLKTCDRNNVFEKELKTDIVKHSQDPYPSCQSNMRKTIRPSISPCSPELRKTPSVQQLKKILTERKDQPSWEENNDEKQAQNAIIQKNCVELHEKLQKSLYTTKNEEGVLRKRGFKLASVKSYNLAADCLVRSNSPAPKPNLVAQNKDDKPIISIELNDNHCTSPYLPAIKSLFCKTQSLQTEDWDNQNSEITHSIINSTKASSEFWYKPHISRKDAVLLLRDCEPGTFLIRNSATFCGAFGLVLRVAKTPAGISSMSRSGDELVRHFLLERTNRGIRLKGCSNEPTFSSLLTFVYQHSNNNLALPCTLIIPKRDFMKPTPDEAPTTKKMQVVTLGSAFNVLYLYQCELETLTGDEAVLKAINEMLSEKICTVPLQVQLNISHEGITLTDNTRKKFFRRHYRAQNISYFSIDPNHRNFIVIANDKGSQQHSKKLIFAFVAQSLFGKRDNQCHILCDLEPSQPASAIIKFAHKIMLQKNGLY